jgi:small multidrug resistance pump
MNALTSLSVMAKGYNPGITPNFNAPWLPSVQSVGGMIVATAIVLLGVLIVIGAVTWVVGKLGSFGNAQSAGLTIILVGVVAAVIIGSVGGIIAWASGIPLFA